MKTLLSMLMLLASSSVAASLLGTERTLHPTVMTELAIVSVADTEESNRIAVLGDKAVVKRGVSVKRASAASGSGLLVIQHPTSGRYGTTDGGILVFLHTASDLQGLAADYGLKVKDALSVAPVGVLIPVDIKTSISFLEPLRSDPRVIDAQIDANYYDKSAN